MNYRHSRVFVQTKIILIAVSRQRILFYCQSLAGIGHLTASLHIIQELIRWLDVDLIYGGIPYREFPSLPGLRVLQLASLVFTDEGDLASFDTGLACEDVWKLRKEQIRQFATAPYQAIVFEFYPFGRRKFKKEIRGIIDQIKAQSGPVPLFSQIREVLLPTDFVTEQKILEEVNGHFHSVLVRGDPAIISLDETFSLASQLGERLYYGGYICPSPAPVQVPRKPQIIVSQGGGRAGWNLLAAAIKTAPLLPKLTFVVAMGSGATVIDRDNLQELATTTNVQIIPFSNKFRDYLAVSTLSINMGGDNTLLEVISTRTPSLSYPYPGNTEQTLRIRKLAERGWVTPLNEADLEPDKLAAKIISTLEKPYPESAINLNGAANISERIRSVLAGER